MGYIEELFQESFWSNQSRLIDLVIPTSGPKSYVMNTTTTKDWRELLDDDGVGHLVDQMEDQVQISKRARIEQPDRTIPHPSSSVLAKARRLKQTKLWNTRTRAEEQLLQMKADLISDATAEGNLREARELESNEAGTQYRAPALDQPAIDDSFRYVNEEDWVHDLSELSLNPDSYLYDPLLKSPDQLTVQDKWLLLEDLVIISLQWDSATFLAVRTELNKSYPGAQWPFYPVSPAMYPSNMEGNWNEACCDMLKDLRKKYPDRGILIERRKAREEKKKLKTAWRIRSEMEELVVRKGGSRLDWLKDGEQIALEQLGLKGMTAENFDEMFRGGLLRLRAAQVEKNNAQSGKEMEKTEESSKVEQTNKITKYFGT
jgi:hypothetical protein